MYDVIIIMPWLTDYKYQFFLDLAKEKSLRILVYSFRVPDGKVINPPEENRLIRIEHKKLFSSLYQVINSKACFIGMLHLNSISSVPLILATILGKKVIFWESGYTPDRIISSLILKVKVWIYGFSNMIVFYSNHGMNKFVRAGFDGDCVVAVNTVKTGEQLNNIRFTQKVTNLVYLGGVTEKKGILKLLDAIKDYNSGTKEIAFSLLVIGPCNDTRIIERLNADRFCEYNGPLYGDELLSALTDIDTLFMPGLGGLAVNHGLASGKVVVAHKGDGSVYDLLKHCPEMIMHEGTKREILDKLRILSAMSHGEVLRLKEINARIFKESFSYDLMLQNFYYAIQHSL